MLSHVSQVATKKKLSIEDSRVTVTARFNERGSVLGGTQTGKCDGFEIQVAIDSVEAPDKIRKLLALAHQMCFTEDVLTRSVKLSTAHLLNGEPIDSSTHNS